MATQDLEVRWSVPVTPERILLHVEDEEKKVALSIDLPGDATSFTLPNDWLQPGVIYTLDIKLIAENGNQTARDVRFTTADLASCSRWRLEWSPSSGAPL